MSLRKVIAVMKYLGIKPKLKSFEDKLVIQKTVCLLELMGFNMRYKYSMYVRGPYSPDLTEDMYQKQSILENLESDYSVTKNESARIEKLKEISNDLDPTLLEIMCTYAFLKIDSKMDNKQATTELKRIKPFFSEGKIAVGISRAKELFPPSKKEIQEMKEEFAEWESAAMTDFKY